MVKMTALLVFCFIGSFSLVPSASATIIGFSADLSIEARYNLTIGSDIDYGSLLKVGSTVDLSGFGDRYTGNYYVFAAGSGFSGDGYATYFVLDRQEGAIVDSEGNTDFILTFLNYEFSTFDSVQGDNLITKIEFKQSIPEPSILLLLSIGLVGLFVNKLKGLAIYRKHSHIW